MHPHWRAIQLSVGATALLAAIALALLVLVLRRSSAGHPAGKVAVTGLITASTLAVPAAYLSLVFVGMAFNGGSYEHVVREENGVVRAAERRDMWGRSGLCLYWNDDGALDLERSGSYSGDARERGFVAFHADGVGLRVYDAKNDVWERDGPWLYLDAAGEPDEARTGWYADDRPRAPGPGRPAGPIQRLQDDLLEDLLRAWESR